MMSRKQVLSTIVLTLLAVPFLAGESTAEGPDNTGQAPRSRFRIVTQSSEERLEDIQESREGTRLLTHDRGFAPRLWDAKTLRLLRILGGQADNVSWVSFSPDGSKVLCVAETEAALWDSRTANVLHRFAPPTKDNFASAAFSPDSKSIAFGTRFGLVLLVDVQDPLKNPRMLRGHSGAPPLDAWVRCLEFSRDGKKLISSSVDKTARIWDIASDKCLATLVGHEHIPQWAHFSGDGKYALTTSLDNVAHLFDANSGKQLWTKPHFIGPKGSSTPTHMSALFVGRNRDLVLIAGQDGTMTLYDPATGAENGALKGHTKAIREIRESLDGTKIATYGDDEQLKIWNVEARKEYPFPHRTHKETAGDFSPDGKTWWLGHEDGRITKHDVETGAVSSQALGAVQTMYGALLPSTAGRLWTMLVSYQVHWLPGRPAEFNSYRSGFEQPEISPDGTFMLETLFNEEFPLVLSNMKSGSGILAYKNQLGARFSWDSSKFVTWKSDGNASVRNSSDGEFLKGWKWDEKYRFSISAFARDNKTVISGGPADGGFVLDWDFETGKSTHFHAVRTGQPTDLVASPDGRRFAVVGDKGLELFDVATFEPKAFVAKDDAMSQPERVAFTPDSRRVVLFGKLRTSVYDAESGEFLWTARSVAPIRFSVGRIAPQGDRVLTLQENQVTLRKIDTGEVVGLMLLSDEAHSAAFTPDGSRILTVDATDGMTIWDAKPGVNLDMKRMGAFVVMHDGKWLAYDMEGRFDAADPDHTEGAHFVMEWSGGLEPIALKQLKAQFYDPGLLAKLLGIDKDPPRPVPDLKSLRLAPAVSARANPANPMSISVELEERDEGGLGNVLVSVNGKLVLSRRATGFFKLDMNDYRQFLLPETHLPAGQGNLVQISASNESGTLTSLPITLDIGAPKDLKVPAVRIYALCVGIGDYAGTQGDLVAPPSDAKAMGQAIRDVGERLLPGRVDVTVMETESDVKPSRNRIMSWFESTAQKATSSDVLFVFFAGHGVSRIGEQSGYFFLTPEADPTEVNALSVSTQTISGEDLKSMLGKIAATKQVIILDTCHSGAASKSLLEADRSLSGDYQRAWESIRDATGVWMLAGSAADQLSYESANVEHGMLTYALLEAIDRASPDGLRSAPSGDLFVDVEKWLTYAAGRVESLKNEVGLNGVQRPEFRRAKSGSSFDIGVTTTERRGLIGLKAPKPIVIMGNFSMDEEDPVGLEAPIKAAFRESTALKAWFEVAKHPGVYRVAGSYSIEDEKVKIKVFLQKFNKEQERKTLETFELEGAKGEIAALAGRIRNEIESRVAKLEAAKPSPSSEEGIRPPGLR